MNANTTSPMPPAPDIEPTGFPSQMPAIPPAPLAPDVPTPVAMLGVPFDRVTADRALRIVAEMIAAGRPHYIATANVDFAVQALGDVELRRILADASLVLCDGMPLVWASRLLGNPLPERVAGSDLVPLLLSEAERKGWRVFFLGGTTESLAHATANVRAIHPGLQIVGASSPPFKPLIEMDHEGIINEIKAARPDLLLVAFGCPKQEKWISMNFRQAGVPVAIGVGATIDFLAGTMQRAPRWMQRSGLEWVFRVLQEPRRLFRRYVTDLHVFGRAILAQLWHLHSRQDKVRGLRTAAEATPGVLCNLLRFGECLDVTTVAREARIAMHLAERGPHLIVDLSRVRSIDSTGLGLLLRLRREYAANQRLLVLVAPSPVVAQALALTRVTELFAIAADRVSARELINERLAEQNVVATLDLDGQDEPLAWQGEITAANAYHVWELTRTQLDYSRGRDFEMNVNLAAVRFIDSTGVRLMVRVRKEARLRGVRLKFTDPQPSVRETLRLLQMEKHLLS